MSPSRLHQKASQRNIRANCHRLTNMSSLIIHTLPYVQWTLSHVKKNVSCLFWCCLPCWRVANLSHSQVIVMFRSRFAEAFPKHVPNLGPQDIEFGVLSPEPSEQVEQLLCGLLGLVLNRKKHIEYDSPNSRLPGSILCSRIRWKTRTDDANLPQTGEDTMDEPWKKQSQPKSINGQVLGAVRIPSKATNLSPQWTRPNVYVRYWSIIQIS